MDRARLRSWRIFTVAVAAFAGLLGYLIGASANNISHTESWQQGYEAALQDYLNYTEVEK